MRIAAVDLGTNSFLCLVAEVHGLGDKRTLTKVSDLSRVVRLGEKINYNKFFLPAALKRAEICFQEFSEVIKNSKVDHVIATATSAARDAKNGGELISLGNKYGIPITIIGGEKEARLSFAGAVSAVKDAANKNILVVDVGGGSTELIFREKGQTKINGVSFDVGCVRLTEMFLKADPVDEVEFQQLASYAVKTFLPYPRVNPDLIIAVAGTPTTLACVDQKINFDEYKVEGFVLSAQRIAELRKTLGAMAFSKRKEVPGLEPLRADVIVAGAALLEVALSLVQKNELTVSTRGLRYGTALHYEEFKK